MLRNCRSVFFLFSDCTKLCILNSFLLKNVWATATILQLPWHLRWLFLKSTDLYSRILSGFYRYGYRLRELHAFRSQLRLDTQNSVPLASPRNCAMAKRTKSRNRMQIISMNCTLDSVNTSVFWEKYRECRRSLPFTSALGTLTFSLKKTLQNHPPFQFVCLSLVLVITSLACFTINKRDTIQIEAAEVKLRLQLPLSCHQMPFYPSLSVLWMLWKTELSIHWLKI